MAEIEHFVDPTDKRHPKFKKYAEFKLPLFSGKDQEAAKELSWMPIGEAV